MKFNEPFDPTNPQSLVSRQNRVRQEMMMHAWWEQQRKNRAAAERALPRVPIYGARAATSPIVGKPVAKRVPAGAPRLMRPTALIRRLWAEFDVWHEGRIGMRIHVSLSVSGYAGRAGNLVAYFSHANGLVLRDANNSYTTRQGQVCVAEPFSPAYSTVLFGDFALFMPYQELHVGLGRHELELHVEVHDDGHRTLARSNDLHFVYTG